ncbi:TetR/AcrR family transcriptional regulator [Paenibacillus sp. GCM10027626]|uniref:TetR/AcrR family transcriptional regulator n=1 Tax=Paenibacillus sp. GCM10027626 TaxID=3273411 RepID=UPI00364584E5
MNGFHKRREQKKQQILRSLQDLIMNRSFKEIGVREIAEKAGVSPASIYNFFGSKEELAKQVFYHYMEEEGKAFQAMMESELSFEEKLERMYELSITKQETVKQDGLKNFMFEDSAFNAYIEQYSKVTIIPAMMKLVEQGKAEHKITKSVSSEAIMFFVHAIMLMVSDPKVKESLNTELRKEIGHLFLYGVFGQREGGEQRPPQDEKSR